MVTVAITQNNAIESAVDDALVANVTGAKPLGFNPEGEWHRHEAARLGVGASDLDQLTFPAMSLKDAIRAFRLAVYGERLTFEHA